MEGLAFVQSRIATVDSHLVTFLLASLLFYALWRKHPGRSPWWLAAAGLAAGMMLATKWTGVYLLALLGMDILISWILRLRKFSFGDLLAAFFALAVMPAAVYVASYAQYFAMGHGWRDFLAVQPQMLSYHTHMKDRHTYQSVPWQWILNVRPVWLHVDYGTDGRIANIYNLGNSVVLYFGLVAMATLGVMWAICRKWATAFLVVAYLIFWLPWALSPRVVFFYHYLPAVPVLCVASGLLLGKWMDNRRRFARAAAWGVLVLAVAWFVFFFPQMTALPVSRAWAENHYYWLSTWK